MFSVGTATVYAVRALAQLRCTCTSPSCALIYVYVFEAYMLKLSYNSICSRYSEVSCGKVRVHCWLIARPVLGNILEQERRAQRRRSTHKQQDADGE